VKLRVATLSKLRKSKNTPIIATDGRIDVIIHNAGHMVFGPAEAFTVEQLAELYDINVLSSR
jgi:NADP-dependent 3-hydroxy acid dehydrogenase YdfG